MEKPHAHSPNGLGARDENGRMVCWCGTPYDDHAAAQAARALPAEPLFIPLGPPLGPFVRAGRDEAADAMAAALGDYLENGTTGDRERAQVALDRYRGARG